MHVACVCINSPTSDIRALLFLIIRFNLYLIGVILGGLDKMSKNTKVKILKLNGKHLIAWKVKIHTISVKDRCVITLKGKGKES